MDSEMRNRKNGTKDPKSKLKADISEESKLLDDSLHLGELKDIKAAEIKDEVSMHIITRTVHAFILFKRDQQSF